MLGVLLGVAVGRLCLCVWCGLRSVFEAQKNVTPDEMRLPFLHFEESARKG